MEIDLIIDKIKSSEKIDIKSRKGKTIRWVALMIFTVLVTFSITGLWSLMPIILILGIIGPLIALYFSKASAIQSYEIKVIDSETENESEKKLLELISSLSQKAGLEDIPEIGIFDSKELNAFATGFSKKDSIVAFSTALLDSMEEDSFTAVVAHEIAHIANGDMVTMQLLQSVINIFVICITLPIQILKFFIMFSSKQSDTSKGIFVFIIELFKMIAASVVLFLGSLVKNKFSRNREYSADKMGGELYSPQAMVKALEILKENQSDESSQLENDAYAAFKISNPYSQIWELFSTHPALDKRIAKLTEENLVEAK